MHLVKSIDCNLLSFPSVGAEPNGWTGHWNEGEQLGERMRTVVHLNCRTSNPLHQEPMIAENDVEAE